ncbi:MAG: hypothetical protein ACYCST_11190 [Acidimicrobiales bacterium]
MRQTILMVHSLLHLPALATAGATAVRALTYKEAPLLSRGRFFKWCRFPSNRGGTADVAGYAGTLAIVSGVDDE